MVKTIVADDVTERIDICRSCGNRSPQRVLFTRLYEVKDSGNNRVGFDWVYFLTACATCDDIMLYGGPHDVVGYSDSPLDEAEVIWPAARALNDSVPERIRQSYEEALRVKPFVPNAFGTLVRRALEAVCIDQGAKGRSLEQKLADLAETGVIPATLDDMSSVVRLLGNRAAHANLEDLREEDVRVLDDFFRMLVEYVYVAPSKLKEFEAALKEAKARKGRSKRAQKDVRGTSAGSLLGQDDSKD